MTGAVFAPLERFAADFADVVSPLRGWLVKHDGADHGRRPTQRCHDREKDSQMVLQR
jgi:hypothetical protein